jgi:glutamine synthetase type III
MGLAKQKSTQARESLERDRELADRLPELLRSVAEAETALGTARASDAPDEELARRGLDLDTALTEAMRAAYAKERVLVGLKGYTDRIHRRKRAARPQVRAATLDAEQLLTAREAHRLHGIPRVPPRVV